eukprot:TRINITY_DN32565_c0_g3_i1.p1 TRINITY_DN32565_c0_g3~~TRINITY_DN32565_c0_g3_i1.p1  ORF type:complete len:233 (-),score=32.32 TRINITY_DN32565_c0_g3_i1:124-822(-)
MSVVENQPAYSESLSVQQLQKEVQQQQQLQQGLQEGEYEQKLPCTFSSLGMAAMGGIMGYVFGFGSTMIMHKGVARFAAAGIAAANQAKTFAALSGVFAFSSCIVTRIRLKEDAISHGVAGCTSGFAMGFSQGPMSGLQSCLGFGVLSYIAFRLSGDQVAYAAQTQILERNSSQASLNYCFNKRSSQLCTKAKSRQISCIQGNNKSKYFVVKQQKDLQHKVRDKEDFGFYLQ